MVGFYTWRQESQFVDVSVKTLKTTVTAAQAKTQFSRLLKQVEAGETIAISKRDETVAFLIPCAATWKLWVETMEVLGNPAAMQAIRQHQAGKLSFHPLSRRMKTKVELSDQVLNFVRSLAPSLSPDDAPRASGFGARAGRH